MKRVGWALAVAVLFAGFCGCGQKGDPSPRKTLHSPGPAPAPTQPGGAPPAEARPNG